MLHFEPKPNPDAAHKASPTITSLPLSSQEGRQKEDDHSTFHIDDTDISQLYQNNPSQTSRLAYAPEVPVASTIRPTHLSRIRQDDLRRNNHRHGATRHGDFARLQPLLSEHEALQEANRCLQCADAPCTSSCPTSIDVKAFIGCVQHRNYYGAAHLIFGENPCGLSCGMLCSTSKLCGGSCVLNGTVGGPIQIGRLQEYATRVTAAMRIPQMVHPSVRALEDPVLSTPIAVIGSGPAGLSCATFLARMGYKKVSVLERNATMGGGGVVSAEVPQHRAPYEATTYEMSLLKELGVDLKLGRSLGGSDTKYGNTLTLRSLAGEGYQAIFLGVGLSSPIIHPVFEALTPAQHVWNSKEFLREVALSSKPGAPGNHRRRRRPSLRGHVVICGFGDIALDCATSAFRCGASRVTVAFRKGFNWMKVTEEQFQLARKDRCEFVPYGQPCQVITDGPGGTVSAVRFTRMEETHEGKFVDTGTEFELSCVDYVITALGCTAGPEADVEAMEPLRVPPRGLADVVDLDTMAVYLPGRSVASSKLNAAVFAGGDIVGSTTVVEAANDGKTAAWSIHRWLHGMPLSSSSPEVPSAAEVDQGVPLSVGNVPALLTLDHIPPFYTAVDDVDLSITMAGLTFINPCGLASAPPCTTIPMIRRAFQQGWAFAVTKTISRDEDIVTNISPRIVRGTASGSGSAGSWMNIELVSEKSARYWFNGIRILKREFPDRIVVASLMAGYNQAAWTELTRDAVRSGADAIELNLSCPHGMGEKGMGKACGEDPCMIEDITHWVVVAAKDGVVEGKSGRSPPPVFPKLTPDIADTVGLARAAKAGGAAGVTMLNSFPALGDAQPNGIVWPAVGKAQSTAYGGASGDMVRPIALRKISLVAKAMPVRDEESGLAIMGVGGVSSAESALSFLRAEAGVVQVSSAIMNSDATLIYNLLTGLRAFQYMNARPDFAEEGWVGQSPPRALFADPYDVAAVMADRNDLVAGNGAIVNALSRGSDAAGSVAAASNDAPVSRATMAGRHKIEAERTRNLRLKALAPTPLDCEAVYATARLPPAMNHMMRPSVDPVVKVPPLAEIIGVSNQSLGSIMSMPRDEQVVAIIDDTLCIRCGRCYNACTDSGYQAIEMLADGRRVFAVSSECTGCGLCLAVCPVPGAIRLIPRRDVYRPSRGMDVGDKAPPEAVRDLGPSKDFIRTCEGGLLGGEARHARTGSAATGVVGRGMICDIEDLII